MNIWEALIEFENEKANDCPVPAWYEALGELQRLSWNPDNKSEAELIDNLVENDYGFGIHAMLDNTGLNLTLSVYQINQRPERPEWIETSVTEEDGSVFTTDAPEFEFDHRYFVSEELKVAEEKINLKSAFGSDWKEYLQHLADMADPANARKIGAIDFARSRAHDALSDKLEEKMLKLGLHPFDHGGRNFKGFVSMLVDYHYMHGLTQSALKTFTPILPPGFQPS